MSLIKVIRLSFSLAMETYLHKRERTRAQQNSFYWLVRMHRHSGKRENIKMLRRLCRSFCCFFWISLGISTIKHRYAHLFFFSFCFVFWNERISIKERRETSRRKNTMTFQKQLYMHSFRYEEFMCFNATKALKKRVIST